MSLNKSAIDAHLESAKVELTMKPLIFDNICVMDICIAFKNGYTTIKEVSCDSIEYD